jgi:hypothetical protein
MSCGQNSARAASTALHYASTSTAAMPNTDTLVSTANSTLITNHYCCYGAVNTPISTATTTTNMVLRYSLWYLHV